MEYTVQGPDGQQHVIAGPEGASDQEVIEQAQKLFPGPSALESAGRGFVNNLPLGGQIGGLATSAITPGEDYSQGLQEFTQKSAAAKAAHPIAYGAGAVGGALAPALIPGIGELGIAGNAALGAAYGVGNTDIVKNPEEALKGAAIGGVTGGTLGAIMPSGEGAAEKLAGMSDKSAVQSLNLRPGLLGIPEEELKDLGNFAREADLVNGTTTERAAKAQDLLGQVGAQIGDIGAGAAPLKDSTPFVDALHQHLQDSASIYGADSNPEATIYRQGIANLQQPNLTFDQLQQLKTVYGQRAFDQFGNAKNDAAANVYGQIKDAMKSVVADSPAEYQEAMENYSKLHDIAGGLRAQLQKEQATGIQAKGFGLAGKMGAMVTGGNVPATVGLAGALAPAHPFMAAGALTSLVNNPQVMSKIESGAAEVAPKLANLATIGSIAGVTAKLMEAIHTNPQSLGRFAQPLMQAAQSGGNQGIAATHYLLSNQYPEYNEMMMQGGMLREHKKDETQ